MKFIGSAVVAAALLTVAVASDAPGPGYDALSFDVTVTPVFDTGTIAGTTALTLRSLDDGLRTVTLSANSLTIDAATSGDAPLALAIDGKDLTVTLPRALAKGEQATLHFAYHGAPARGVVFDGDSVFTSYFACNWMICAQDRPGDKATIALDVILPSGMTALGPGAPDGVTSDTRGKQVHAFRLDRPYSAFLYAFAAGRFDRWVDADGPTKIVALGRDIAPAQLAARFHTTRAMLDFFEDKAGVAFPGPAYTQLYVPQSQAQETATFSLIGEPEIGPILADPQEDWVIAHELAHQWWGNLITCADWSEFWLNEGVVSFMTAAWKEHAFGRAAYDREMDLFRARVARAKEKGVDAKLTFRGPYPSLGLKRAIVYAKGALFMDALRSELGDAVFWRALKAYTRAHIGDAVTSRDFQAAFEAEAGRSLQPLFDAWVYEIPPG